MSQRGWALAALRSQAQTLYNHVTAKSWAWIQPKTFITGHFTPFLLSLSPYCHCMPVQKKKIQWSICNLRFYCLQPVRWNLLMKQPFFVHYSIIIFIGFSVRSLESSQELSLFWALMHPVISFYQTLMLGPQLIYCLDFAINVQLSLIFTSLYLVTQRGFKKTVPDKNNKYIFRVLHK